MSFLQHEDSDRAVSAELPREAMEPPDPRFSTQVLTAASFSSPLGWRALPESSS